MDLELAGRTALVTGAWRGTGQVIAERLAAEGAAVVIHGFEAEPTARAADAAGLPWITGDLLSESGCDAIAADLDAAGHRIDILVSNYGTRGTGFLEAQHDTGLHEMYERNTLSAVRLAQRLTPAMVEAGWGRVIHLGTIGSTRPNSRMPHYYAAKAALAALTVSLAKDLAGTGVTVNTVSPGLIRTAEVEAAWRERAREAGWPDDWETIEARAAAESFPNPVGRMARREEVADLVCFLASPRAGYINAQNIRIDGGSVDSVE